MAYLLLACPQCHAAYKIPKEHAQTEVVCRSCGHRWVPSKPAEVAAPTGAAVPPVLAEPAEPTPPPQSPAPKSDQGAEAQGELQGKIVSPLGALEAMANAAKGGGAAGKAAAPKPPAGRGRAARDDKTDPLVGAQINGFKIQSRVGRGGFGVVYRAFDTNLERSVAIKMLPPRIARAGKGLMTRFLREARSAGKLAHPNIVTIHQICPYEDTYYIVMELVDGGALHEFLAVQKRFSPAEATRIIRAAAEGLAHAHKRGIIHRDIKPGNIMMTNDGQVKVSDFGLARDVLQGQDIVGSGHSLGTPRYMAPEQALGEEPTAASDLYSLAATYYALLTGHAAFDGANDREIMKKQVTAPVPDPRQHVPSLPVAAFRFFEKAMAKQPEERFVTAEEFVAALDRLDFSRADGATPNSQDLIDQIGAISAEDRGSHLTEALGRAVRRAQRQRTPMHERAVENMLGASTIAARKAGWKLWLLIGVVLVVLVAGAIVAAIYFAGRPGSGGPTVTPPEKKTPSGEKRTPSGEKPTPSGEKTTPSGEKTTPSGEKTTPPEPPKPPPPSPLEATAMEVLKEVEAYEADADTPVYELIRMYKENVIGVYPGTKAAAEAQKAIDRLRGGGARKGAAGDAAEKPPEKPPEKAEEKPDEPSTPESTEAPAEEDPS